ncbi:AAA family ATPase [Arthrobacter sp. Sa2CUA1]|uniref:AAA family ATPase n=1 Tax=Arthrobacter gallicola TaxID=2762225 RepID=A0ABR8UV30_9MICC|nr:LuxR family transcriptional regulator [Arthrobacter gallicola]MBD7996096.1 AAA family ATPase [Arthrobacter gallicola]
MPVVPHSPPDIPAQTRVSRPSLLAGRTEAVRSVLGAVESGSGAVIVGQEGIGKTALANHVAAAVADRFHVVYVRGSAVSARSSYGALGWLLSDLPEGILNDPVRVLAELKTYLRHRAAGKPVLLILDNAHELDPQSQMVTAQLARQQAVKLLATTPDLLRCGDGLLRLWSDGVLRRTDLGPLENPDARTLMETVAGGRLSALAARTVWADTQGNPLFTSLLCRDQIAAGRIQHRGDTWTLTGPLTYAGEISDWMENWYRSLPAPERRVIELASLCPGIPISSLLAVADPHAVDALEERGVLRVNVRNGSVYVRERLYARLVARLVPVGRSFDLWHELLATEPDLDRFPDSAAKAYASWSAVSGARLAPGIARRAGAAALAAGDPEAALKITAAVPDYRSSPEVMLERGRALSALGRTQEAEAELQAVVRLGDPATMVAAHLELALARCALDPAAASPAASIASAEEAAAALPADGRKRAGQCALVVRAVLAVREGDRRQLPQGLDQISQDTDVPEAIRLMAGVADAQALAMTGQSDAAAAAAGILWNNLQDAQCLPKLHGAEILTGTISAYMLCGDFTTALEVITKASSLRYLDAHLGAWAELPAGTIHALSGRADAALEYLTPACRQLETNDPADLLPLAYAAAAYCYAVKQDWDRMREILVAAPAFRCRPAAVVLGLTRYFRAAAALERNPDAQTAQPLLVQALEAQQRGSFAEAVLCYGAAAAAGSESAAGHLAAVSAAGTGAAARMYQQLAAGLQRQDGPALLEAAERAMQLGNYGLGYKAAQAAHDAAAVSMDRELIRRSRATANECYRYLAEAHSIGHRLSQLSEFERDLAVRAADGESSIRLGAALHLSSRTIDWHLGRIFQKLHVSGRSELRRLLSRQVVEEERRGSNPSAK